MNKNCLISNSTNSFNIIFVKRVTSFSPIRFRAHLYSSLDLQWVPGHCGLPGNEADRVAREAASDGREGRAGQDVPVNLQAAKSAINQAVKDPNPQHECVPQVYQGPLKHLQGISRKEEILLARLRIGHCLHLAAYRD